MSLPELPEPAIALTKPNREEPKALAIDPWFSFFYNEIYEYSNEKGKKKIKEEGKRRKVLGEFRGGGSGRSHFFTRKPAILLMNFTARGVSKRLLTRNSRLFSLACFLTGHGL